MNEIFDNADYKIWLNELKAKIQRSQIKAALSVNAELIALYWELGRQIGEKSKAAKWGDGFILRLADDLKSEFPEMGGFSRTNLNYCRKFFEFYTQTDISGLIISPEVIGEQLVRQIPKKCFVANGDRQHSVG